MADAPGGPRALTRAQVYARLNRAVRAAGTQRAFCRAHGVSEAVLSEALNARREPGPSVLAAIGVLAVATVRYVDAAPPPGAARSPRPQS